MISLAQALTDLKGSTKNENILGLIERQEGLIVEASKSKALPNFDSILQDLVNGVPLEGHALDNVDILSHMILTLYNRVERLEEENTRLASELESYQQTEEELHDELEDFRLSLSGSTVGDLMVRYDVENLLSFEPRTRIIICRELIDYARSLQKEPSVLWKSLVSNDGKFEN